MKDKIIEVAKKNSADVIGFAPASRFDADDPIFKIMHGTKTVIGLGFRILRGIYRGIEEGSTYYQYTTMAVENMEETIMPMAQLKVAMTLEESLFRSFCSRKTLSKPTLKRDPAFMIKRMVAVGRIQGMLMCQIRWSREAPSIMAAS